MPRGGLSTVHIPLNTVRGRGDTRRCGLKLNHRGLLTEHGGLKTPRAGLNTGRKLLKPTLRDLNTNRGGSLLNLGRRDLSHKRGVGSSKGGVDDLGKAMFDRKCEAKNSKQLARTL
jgi:hypothetical protein